MHLKILILFIVIETTSSFSSAQEDRILKQLDENGIELKIDSSDIFELKKDTSFFLYYHCGNLSNYLQGKISNQKIYYDQVQLLKAKKYMEVSSLNNLDTTKLINAISKGARGVEEITFMTKSAYSGVYYDKSLEKKELSFFLFTDLFKYDKENNEYLKYKSDSLVDINWVKNLELEKYVLMLVFKSKEYIPKEFDKISHIDLWYQRLLLIDFNNYIVVSDEIRSKQHVSYYHSR